MTSHITQVLHKSDYDTIPIYYSIGDKLKQVRPYFNKDFTFKPSTIGVPNQGNIIDEKYRTSFIATEKFEIKFSNECHYSDDATMIDYENIHKKLLKLLPKKYKKFPMIFDFPDCVLLKYDKGSFFKTHVDAKKSQDHIATGLLYPPCSYDGGELYIYEGENKIQIEKNSSRWQFVAIKLGVPHEVTEITNGSRYVFKFNIMMSDVTKINFIPNKIYYKPLKLNNKKTELFREIKENFARLTGDDSINVILASYYRYPMPHVLDEEDTNLYNTILTKIENSVIFFENVKINNTDKYKTYKSDDPEYMVFYDVSLPKNIINIEDKPYIYQSKNSSTSAYLLQRIQYAWIYDQEYYHNITQATIMNIKRGIKNKTISDIIKTLSLDLIDIIMEYIY
jgi:hypothetical protein